jgi:hypothetical protein
VLIDAEGRPRAAVIDFGGFLGVGSRKIAVHWQALEFQVGERPAPLILKLEKADVQAAPEFKHTSQPAEVVAPAAPGEQGAEPPVIASPESQPPDAAADQPPAAAEPAGTPAPPGPPTPKTPDAGTGQPRAAAPPGTPAPPGPPHACCQQPPAAAQQPVTPAPPGPAPAPKALDTDTGQPPAAAQPRQPIPPNGPPAPDAGR